MSELSRAISAASVPDPIDVQVGANIRARRKELHVSQTALADYLGLTFQQVQKYERGANRVSASVLWRMCTRLDCPITYPFEGLATIKSGDLASGRTAKAMRALDAVPELEEVPTLPLQARKALGLVIKGLLWGDAATQQGAQA